MNQGHYTGLVASLATRHAKDEAIGPVFRDVLGLDVVVIDIDTDAFGTFAGEIPRTDTPVNTAIAKACAGMTASGHSIGLASEGTIGPDPLLPFVTSDIETIVFIDDTRQIVLSETWRSGDIVTFREVVSSDTDLSKFAQRADFPRHGLIVRPSSHSDGPIIKGITTTDALLAAVEQCFSADGGAVVESDFRACYSPSRMRNIGECAKQLALRINTSCPDCAGPGWGRIQPIRGLPCSDCGTLVESAVRADVFGCPACPAVQEVPRSDQTAEPRWCPLCNP